MLLDNDSCNSSVYLTDFRSFSLGDSAGWEKRYIGCGCLYFAWCDWHSGIFWMQRRHWRSYEQYRRLFGRIPLFCADHVGGGAVFWDESMGTGSFYDVGACGMLYGGNGMVSVCISEEYGCCEFDDRSSMVCDSVYRAGSGQDRIGADAGKKSAEALIWDHAGRQEETLGVTGRSPQIENCLDVS